LAFDWMMKNAQCTAAEIAHRANRLGEVIRTKEKAAGNRDYDLAADMRAEEPAIFESLGMRAPKGWTWNTILTVGIAEQTLRLSTMFMEIRTPPPSQCRCTERRDDASIFILDTIARRR
jgi:hypothetical protein